MCDSQIFLLTINSRYTVYRYMLVIYYFIFYAAMFKEYRHVYTQQDGTLEGIYFMSGVSIQAITYTYDGIVMGQQWIVR